MWPTIYFMQVPHKLMSVIQQGCSYQPLRIVSSIHEFQIHLRYYQLTLSSTKGIC